MAVRVKLVAKIVTPWMNRMQLQKNAGKSQTRRSMVIPVTGRHVTRARRFPTERFRMNIGRKPKGIFRQLAT